MIEWRTHLTSDPAVCGGQLCAKGTRIADVRAYPPQHHAGIVLFRPGSMGRGSWAGQVQGDRIPLAGGRCYNIAP
jgi:hypothetical protein